MQLIHSMHVVKQLITFSLYWLLIKESKCSFQSGKQVKSPFTVLKGPFGLHQCVKECLLRKRCQALGYRSRQLRCELGGSKDVIDASDPDDQMAFRANLSEYQQLLGRCANHMCDTGQKCVVLKSGQLKCATSDCNTSAGYSMINSGDDYVCLKVYSIGPASVSYQMSASRCEEDGGRLMIMNKAWKINTAVNLINSAGYYFINGFKNENGVWKYSDGNDFVEIASVTYESRTNAYTETLLIRGNAVVYYHKGDVKAYGFICET